MRKLSVKSILRLAACLFILPACAWLLGTPLQTVPAPTRMIVAPIPTQAANLPTGLPMQATLAPASTSIAGPLYGQSALKHIEALSETIGPRAAGTSDEVKAAQYIEAVFQSLGYQTSRQPFTFTDEAGITQNSANVIAVKTGQSSQSIIVGAHYDSVAVGKGADDNASGVAVMLEAAEMVKDLQTLYTIRFIAFGAEEAGLYGSDYYVKQMSEAEIQNTTSMINLDSLIAGNTPNVYGNATPDGSLRNWFLAYAKSQGIELLTQPVENLDNPDGSPCDCSDYSAFQKVGIPFAYFEATDWTLGDQDGWTQVDPKLGQNGEIWNTKYDYLDYINQNFPGRAKQHLDLFVRLLFGALTQFK